MRAMPDVLVEPRIPFAKMPIVDEAREAVARVLASGWVTSGPEVEEFERAIAERVRAPFAVAVAGWPGNWALHDAKPSVAGKRRMEPNSWTATLSPGS